MTERSISPARITAFTVLHRVGAGRADPASLLHGKLSQGLSAADLDLATEIVYGVLRWQNRLDYILETESHRPAEKIDAPVLLALRIGLYQMSFLSRVPAHAAVDEAVKLARAHGPRGSPGFVNAVLRAIGRRREPPPLPTKADDPLGYLMITLSHPRWLARRYLERLGLDAAEARCLRNNTPPPSDLRVEPPLDAVTARGRLAGEGIVAEPFDRVPCCLRARSGNPAATSLCREGSVFIQEAGSQLIPHLLGLRRGDRVLDACAAPGAKASQISRWVDPGLTLAVDRRLRRLAVTASIARRLECNNLIPVCADAENLPFLCSFSRILLDAPCSSLGTLARNPDIKWRLREEDLAAYSARQRRLLDSCARLLAPGGRLVYATCSTEPDENEQVISAFLHSREEFQIAPPPTSFPDRARNLLSEDGCLRILPERDDMDGYFAVVLEKKEAGES